MLKNKKISIIVPVYNEAKSLTDLNASIINNTISLCNCYEIIYIDDGSTDDSLKILKNIKQRYDQIKIIQLRKNFGKSTALSIGFNEAEGNFIITMDADLQDDPSEIPNFINKLIKYDFDLISGWKMNRKDPFIKIISSKIFNFTVKNLTGIKIHDFNCGFKVYKKEVVKNINIYGELHRFLPVLANEKGFKIGEIKIKHNKRKYGKSKYGKFGLRRIMNYFLDPINIIFLTKYSKKPAHFFGNIGFLFLGTGFLFCLYLTLIWFLDKGPIGNRPLLFLGILLIVIGIQLISMGFLGELIISGKSKNQDNSLIKKKY